MIGEQLHRHRIDQRRDQRVDLGHLDRRDAAFARLGDALRRR